MSKDYSQYSNIELYEMSNHLDPYKYQDRIEEVQREIEFRKSKGEVAAQIIPSIDWEPLKFWKRRKNSELVTEVESGSA